MVPGIVMTCMGSATCTRRSSAALYLTSASSNCPILLNTRPCLWKIRATSAGGAGGSSACCTPREGAIEHFQGTRIVTDSVLEVVCKYN